ncbi:hypothetical protein [Paenibacillus xerothermodurans]|nr:hypothetical protein [Paenibacillus xerothermodurans]
MPNETELNQTVEENSPEDAHEEWLQQVNEILAPRDPEPMRD